MKGNDYIDDFIYKPPETFTKVINAKMGVKFCKDLMLLESFLIKQGIEYKKEDLERTPFGLALRVKRK